MVRSDNEGFTRRGVARLGALAAAFFTSASAPSPAGSSRPQSDVADIDVTRPPFLAPGDGQSDDAAAIMAAVAALPTGGGIIRLPGARTYRLRQTVNDGGKPVTFEIGHAQVIGPQQGPLFDLRTNGSGIKGAGAGGTVLRIVSPIQSPIAPQYSLSLHDGRVASAVATSAGAGLRSTPLLDVEDGLAGSGAALLAQVEGGAVRQSEVAAGGSSHRSIPRVRMLGGGECAVRIAEANHCQLSDFSIDLDGVPHAVGIFQYGGWYADVARIDICAARQHPTAIALLVDSHTLGEPGPNGSFGGAYVNRYAQIVAKRVFVVGHDRSSATTLHFDTLDGANLHVHGAAAITLTNAVLQDAEGAFLDLVNVDGVSMIGGDIEGSAALVRARGSCNNVRLAPLAYNATGPIILGSVGSGWRLDLAKSNAAVEALCTGSSGSTGTAYQNTGWPEKHRVGIPYSGDSLVSSSNVRMTGPRAGILDNPANPCFALIMTISGQLILRHGAAGSRHVALTDLAMFDGAGLAMPGLPASRPAAGSKRLWYDPSDAFRVKFQP